MNPDNPNFRTDGVWQERLRLFYDLRIIHELVTGDDPYQALEMINDNFDGEERELLISIFGLEDLAGLEL